jgi:hypothetical protein
MKLITKIGIVSISLLFTDFAFSQSDSEQTLRHATSVTSFDARSRDVEGSIYINDELLPAKLSNSEIIYAARYDAYQDEMEIQRDGKLFYLPKTFDVTITFLNSNKTYQVYSYDDKGTLRAGYFAMLEKGEKISLLNREKIKFVEEVMPKSGYEKYKPPMLKRESDQFFIGYKNNTTVPLPKKKDEILALFSSKANEVQSYAKSNKLGFKKSEDLIEIFRFYNSLN